MKKIPKKVLIPTVSVLLVLLLSSCGSKSSTTGAGNAAQAPTESTAVTESSELEVISEAESSVPEVLSEAESSEPEVLSKAESSQAESEAEGREDTGEPEAEEKSPEQEEESSEEEAVPETLRTLDDYLDYAQEQKTAGMHKAAAAAYKKAIDSYGDDPYAPFVVIELGNLYKDIGLYDESSEVYEKALSLPMLQGQTDIQAEFKKNIIYLHTVSHILTRHDVPNTPFRKIPPEYIEEIETEFKKSQADETHRRNYQ